MSVRAAQQVAPKLLAGQRVDLSEFTRWVGRGEELDLDAVEKCVATVKAERESFSKSRQNRDLDRFEGRAARLLHQSLGRLPGEAADDPGLWRYLTLQHFWELVVWRERSAFDTGDYGKYRQYIDGTNPSECVLTRMFLRARIVEDQADYEVANAVPFGADLWRSHILRVRTGTAPVIARALIRSHSANRMSTDELRDLARRLNRLWTNVVLHTYDDDEADALITELREASKDRKI
jgi:hypothetical protein